MGLESFCLLLTELLKRWAHLCIFFFTSTYLECYGRIPAKLKLQTCQILKLKLVNLKHIVQNCLSCFITLKNRYFFFSLLSITKYFLAWFLLSFCVWLSELCLLHSWECVSQEMVWCICSWFSVSLKLLA